MHVWQYIDTPTQNGPLAKCSGSRVYSRPTDMWVCSPGLCAKLNKGLGKMNGLLVVHCREGAGRGQRRQCHTGNSYKQHTLPLTGIKHTHLQDKGSRGIPYKCSVKTTTQMFPLSELLHCGVLTSKPNMKYIESTHTTPQQLLVSDHTLLPSPSSHTLTAPQVPPTPAMWAHLLLLGAHCSRLQSS